ncbi:MAG: tryptophan 2,3-dioxygenase family protein [Flavobacteriales bacterium]|nr:tryptophan 2,3-dioxygenase family protein [Flavobacteriales bacterium]
MSDKASSVHYIDYLSLDKILNAQNPLSKVKGEEAHEEMLFIIIHQTYELWFKQIIHELNSTMTLFEADKIDESNIGVVVGRMDRVNKIMTTLVGQLDVLETMTSLDFLDFRDYLSPASGFQSHQFRKIEVMLGLKLEKRHQFGGCPYHSQFKGDHKKEILALEDNISLFSLVEKWLERIPFLTMDGFDFIKKYDQAVNEMLQKEIHTIQTANLTEKDQALRIRMIDENRKYFNRVLSEKEHNKAMSDGETQLSYKATMSALLINLYRDEPILHSPYQFLRSLIELDHKISTWRFRHVQMVEKMLGLKIGTGGSSGQGYLKKTVDQHKFFTDLANVSTLMINRSYLPKLPNNIVESLGFNYNK